MERLGWALLGAVITGLIMALAFNYVISCVAAKI